MSKLRIMLVGFSVLGLMCFKSSFAEGSDGKDDIYPIKKVLITGCNVGKNHWCYPGKDCFELSGRTDDNKNHMFGFSTPAGQDGPDGAISCGQSNGTSYDGYGIQKNTKIVFGARINGEDVTCTNIDNRSGNTLTMTKSTKITYSIKEEAKTCQFSAS